jgi:hypothetical protein
MKKVFAKFLLVVSCLLAISNCLNAQELLLPTEAEVWGMPQTINLNDGDKIKLRTMFIKHYGTTCVFKVEFTNIGSSKVKETVQLTNNNGIYVHWASDLRLDVNEWAVYEMEKRECKLTLNKKKQKDISKCAECKPTIKFLKKG